MCLFFRCRTAIIVIIVACGILGLVIAIANLLIILVIAFNSQFRNSQAIYKLSLAAADLLVGVIVLPLAVDILRRLVWTRHVSMGHVEVKGYQLENGTISENITSVQIAERAGQFRSKFPLPYQNFAGFCTAVSIFVSIYTLAGAGFDRLRAVYNPLTYRKERANKFAKRICIISWLVAILFGVLPLFTPNLSYALVLSITFVTLDFNGLILYSVGLLVPLVIVWGVNIFTFSVSKKHSKFRRQLTKVAQRKRQNVERRLAQTLQLMVAVFTLNTLPLIILLVASLFLPSTRPSLPHQFNLKHGNLFIIVEFIAIMMLFGNSLWNFIIYSYRNRDFRVAVKIGFRRFLKAICFSSCLDSIMICCRSAAHSSRRRFSSFQSSIKNRKKSSLATTITKLPSSSPSDGNLFSTTSGSHPLEETSMSVEKRLKLQSEESSAICETALTNGRKANTSGAERSTFDSHTETDAKRNV